MPQKRSFTNPVGNQLFVFKTASALQKSNRQQDMQKYGEIQTPFNWFIISGCSCYVAQHIYCRFYTPIIFMVLKSIAKR